MATLIKKTKTVRVTRDDGYVLKVTDWELETICRALRETYGGTFQLPGSPCAMAMHKIFVAVRNQGYVDEIERLSKK